MSQNVETLIREVLKRKEEQRTVLLDDEMIAEIKVPDYQWKLNTDRIPFIKSSVTKGIYIPPIVLAAVDGELYIMDGQHRLEARKRMDFPLHAHIVPMDKKMAARNFVVLNSAASRVSLKHRLDVDTSEFSNKTRDMAEKYKTNPTKIYNLIIGFNRSSRSLQQQEIGNSQWALADTILNYWTQDTRWDSTKTIYNSKGMLQLIGRICIKSKTHKNMMDILKKLRHGLDFSVEGTLGRRDGTYGNAQKNMYNYVLEFLFKEGLK